MSSSLQQLLRDKDKAGVFVTGPDTRVIAEAASSAGLALWRLDIGHVHDKQGFIGLVAKALDFPEWFGGNWDALEDCLTDLSWLKANGYVVLLENCAEFVKRAPHEFAMSTQVFESVAEYWDEKDKPFWTLFGGIKAPVSGIKPLA